MKLRKTVEKIIQMQRVFQDSKRGFDKNGAEGTFGGCYRNINLIEHLQTQKINVKEGEAQ
jgi:F0F1-type ATP synthase epsilon subunit